MAEGVMARAECILRAARMARLAQRAVARGNYERCRRLAETARQLMTAFKSHDTAAECSPTPGGKPGKLECAK